MKATTLNLPTLETIGNGGLAEDFNDVLNAVASDIVDPNTDLAKRSITITIMIEPDQRRDIAFVSFGIKTKLGNRQAGKDMFHIGRHVDGDKNKRSFYRSDEKQESLTFDEIGVER